MIEGNDLPEENNLRKIGEFELIERLVRLNNFSLDKAKSLGVEQGPGDDTAVLSLPPGEKVLVTTDTMVENVHFILGKIPPSALGHKLMAVNLSDIAAMGGTPRFGVVSLGIKEGLSINIIEKIYQGMYDLARYFDTVVVGGDTVSSSILTLTLTLMGTAPVEQIVYRSGARPGDVLLVSGSLGKSAAGLELILQEIEVSASVNEQALKAHYRPWPRVREGQVLASLGWVHAMIDISDGLASEVGHICQQSTSGAEIWWDALPIDATTHEIARFKGQYPQKWALFGGEDYELLLAVPSDKVEATQKALQAVGCTLTPVGQILSPDKGICLKKGQRTVPLKPKGFNHFY